MGTRITKNVSHRRDNVTTACTTIRWRALLGLLLLLSAAILIMFMAMPTAVEGKVTGKKADRGMHRDSLPDMNAFIPVDTQPQLIYGEAPEYPPIAENAGLTGKVYLKALLDENGNVIKAVVAKSSGYVWFDEAATEATAKNRYTPAIYEGRPIKYWISLQVDFVLGD